MFASTHPEARQIFKAARRVRANGYRAAEGVGHQRDLRRAGKEIFLDEQIHIRELDAETRMRVVPADDALLRIIALERLVNRVPGRLSESHVRARLTGGGAANDVL